ncbi:phosphoribosyltransferase family protein [Segetibacter koreensis]|uniref:phosphoribosyltransferase family protein n=1 Tax=Segetibacter koreensis TaxID=398037 RepID=UPI000382A7C0|nr:phosphoribosyltransferase family protein [Segetibacter koreensis]
MAKNQILSKEVAERKMERIALEIAGQLYTESEPLIIIGVEGSGMVIANKLYLLLKPLLQQPVQIITCGIDKKNNEAISYSEEIDFNNKSVLLVDDVTSSGRTLLYALKPLLEYQPKRIQTMCLVERMHKNFPVKIDYIGLSIATTLQDHIQVEVEDGEVMGAYIL